MDPQGQSSGLTASFQFGRNNAQSRRPSVQRRSNLDFPDQRRSSMRSSIMTRVPEDAGRVSPDDAQLLSGGELESDSEESLTDESDLTVSPPATNSNKELHSWAHSSPGEETPAGFPDFSSPNEGNGSTVSPSSGKNTSSGPVSAPSPGKGSFVGPPAQLVPAVKSTNSGPMKTVSPPGKSDEIEFKSSSSGKESFVGPPPPLLQVVMSTNNGSMKRVSLPGNFDEMEFNEESFAIAFRSVLNGTAGFISG